MKFGAPMSCVGNTHYLKECYKPKFFRTTTIFGCTTIFPFSIILNFQYEILA